MQTREERDAKTLVIARALATFVVVFAATSALMALAAWLGLYALEPVSRVVVGLAGLLCVGYLMRHRHG